MSQFSRLLIFSTLCLSICSRALPVLPPAILTPDLIATNDGFTPDDQPGIDLSKRVIKPPSGKPPTSPVKPPPANPAKTVAKPTPVKPTPAPAKTTSPPAKTTPAKLTTSKGPPPASKTTQATIANPAKSTGAAACPLPKKPAKTSGGGGKRSVLDTFTGLFKRADPEFIGFHGTNSDTATFWEASGDKGISKPPKTSGILDFLGLTSTKAGTSGADAELGPGLYIADEPVIAQGFANNNAKVNKGTTPKVCAIFAKESGNWRNVIQKAFIPESLVGDSSDQTVAEQKENKRLAYIKQAGISTTASTVVKFSFLNRQTKTGQLVLPSTITSLFTAKCFDAATDPKTVDFLQGVNVDGFSYNALRSEWKILAEDANAVTAVENGCT